MSAKEDRDNAEADEILDALCDTSPLSPSEMDGSLSCNFCWGDDMDRNHEPMCLWARARKLLGRPEVWDV